jgi:hypothetical protein
MAKRIVGIDLAVTGLHRAAVYDSVSVAFVGKSFTFNRSYEGFMLLLHKATSSFSCYGTHLWRVETIECFFNGQRL